jgi:hypothetical protein
MPCRVYGFILVFRGGVTVAAYSSGVTIIITPVTMRAISVAVLKPGMPVAVRTHLSVKGRWPH